MRLNNWKLFIESSDLDSLHRRLKSISNNGDALYKALQEIFESNSCYSQLEKQRRFEIEVNDREQPLTCRSYEDFIKNVNDILISEGWTKEQIEKAVDEMYNKSNSGVMDLFLYHYKKEVQLGGFSIVDEDFWAAEEELKRKIGYGYHRTPYGRIRHLQNYKGRQKELFHTLFDITFQTIFFGFIEDDNIIKNTHLANEMSQVLKNPELIKSLRVEPIKEGTSLFPICSKWDLVELIEKEDDHYTIQFKIIDFYNSKFTEDLTYTLSAFTEEFTTGLFELSNKTHGMIKYGYELDPNDIPGEPPTPIPSKDIPYSFIKVIYTFYL